MKMFLYRKNGSWLARELRFSGKRQTYCGVAEKVCLDSVRRECLILAASRQWGTRQIVWG